jgi:hypothetical protein
MRKEEVKMFDHVFSPLTILAQIYHCGRQTNSGAIPVLLPVFQQETG